MTDILRLRPEEVSNIIRDVAARYILPRFNALSPDDIRSKSSPSDLVTKADIEAEEAFDIELPRLLQDSVVLGEEGISAGRYKLEETSTYDGYIWVVDPVDGTRNFTNSSPLFATMIALVYRGEAIMSWIYDVLKDEMYFAERGGGAHVNEQALQLPDSSHEPSEIIAFTHPTLRKRLITQFPDSPYVDWHKKALFAASHEYIQLLRGQAHISFYRRVMPWDHIAGVLAVQELGGLAHTWSGAAYTVKTPPEDSGLIVATRPALITQLQGCLTRYTRTNNSL